MVLQLWAAGGATVLAIRDRFITIAGAYMSGALAGLVTFLALMGSAGVQTLGWSMFAMSVVTCTWMLVGVRRSGRPVGAAAVAARARSARPALVARLRPGARAHRHLPRVQRAVRDHARVRQPLGGRRDDGPLLRLPVRQLPRGRHRHGARHVEHPRHDARGPDRAARGPDRHGASRLPLRDPDRRSRAGGPDRLRSAADTRAAPQQPVRCGGSHPAGFRRAARPVDAGRAARQLPAPGAACARSRTAAGRPCAAAGAGAPRSNRAGQLRCSASTAPSARSSWPPRALAAVLLVAASGRTYASGLTHELAGDALRFIGISLLAFGAGWAARRPVSHGPRPGRGRGSDRLRLYLGGLRIVARPQLETLLRAVIVRPAAA